MTWKFAKGSHNPVAHRYPVAVSSSFGLLHGFGFAAVRRDIGLLKTELPTAMLFFNVGGEIGQILFLFAILTAYFTVPPALVRALKSADDGTVHRASVSAPQSA